MERGMIAVDEWGCKREVYFLTHLHADHTRGLSARWRRGPLYCSHVTALLLPIKFPGFHKSLIRVLEVGSTSLISLTSPKTAAQLLVEVTPIDAHHCPGAVMYLFRGEFGCELYTGDFRWEVDGCGGGKDQLLSALGGAKVDHLHLDNTFCNPRFNFPPRRLAAQQVVNIISLHAKHDVVIGIDTLGKEDLLLHIASVLKTKIWVWPERLQIMHLLELPDVFTTDASITRVRAVPRYSLTAETVEVLNSMRPTIGILPTGSSWLFKTSSTEDCFMEDFELDIASEQSEDCSNGFLSGQLDTTTVRQYRAFNLDSLENFATKSVHGNIYFVPYSLHCCFSEIESFIELLKPSCLTGNLSVCEINPNYYFGHLCKGKHSCVIVETYKDTERDIVGKPRAFSPECSTLVNISCKSQKIINGRKVRWNRLRRHRKIYANKVNRSRQKGCGTRLYHWDSDKDDGKDFAVKFN